MEYVRVATVNGVINALKEKFEAQPSENKRYSVVAETSDGCIVVEHDYGKTYEVSVREL